MKNSYVSVSQKLAINIIDIQKSLGIKTFGESASWFFYVYFSVIMVSQFYINWVKSSIFTSLFNPFISSKSKISYFEKCLYLW